MSKLEQARKTWIVKSDEWLYERLANELSDKVQEIHRLLKELDEVKNLTIPAVVKSVCDDCIAYPFDERGKTPLCKTCKDNPSQTVL